MTQLSSGFLDATMETLLKLDRALSQDIRAERRILQVADMILEIVQTCLHAWKGGSVGLSADSFPPTQRKPLLEKANAADKALRTARASHIDRIAGRASLSKEDVLKDVQHALAKVTEFSQALAKAQPPRKDPR